MAILIAFGCLGAALILLTCLAVIDLRHLLLPDKLVLPFAVFGLAFHAATRFSFSTQIETILGVALGGGLLYAVRCVANYLYKEDTLGLGDVKLLAAAGVWLGTDVLIAVIAGAAFGIVHGIGIALYRKAKRKAVVNFTSLSLPAGPGFIAGIILAGAWKFQSLVVG